MFDAARIEEAVLSIIKAVGEDPEREGLQGTPRRIAEMYQEIFSGIHQDPRAELTISFDEGHHEMVVLKDIPFYSLCEHHFLPFYGVVHIGYVPNGRVTGVSKLARLVEVLASRPQLQERLTTLIADTIMEVLQPQGVGVVIQAEHLCMIMRGIKKPGANFITSANRGTFRRYAVTRSEFLSLIQNR